MKKVRILSVVLLLVFPSLFMSVGLDAEKNNDHPVADFLFDLRGIEVDFSPPKILTDCGSQFVLEVKLKNCRMFHRFFSLIVFMDLGDETNHDIQRIGYDPFVHLGPREEKTIKVTCLTLNELPTNVECLNSNEKNELSFDKGKIGVKLSKSFRWMLEGLCWRFIILNELTFEKLILNTYSRLSFYSSFWEFYNQRIKPLDCSVQWRGPVYFSNPFVCTNKIQLYDLKLRTDCSENGNFEVNKNEFINVSFNVTNNLDHDIVFSSLLDFSDEKIYNDLFPTLPEQIYNIDFKEQIIRKNDQNVSVWMNCTFPDKSFRRTTYFITLECGPYLDIHESNLFGLYGYNYRYKTLITPFYLENNTVKESTERFWYNLPIFNKTENADSSILLTHYFPVEYVGENPTEEIAGEVLGEIDKNLFLLVKIFAVIFILPALLWGGIHWIIRKKS